MIKLIVLAVIALLVGIGGGSAVSVMNAKKAYAADVAHKASVVADSLALAEEEGAKHVVGETHGADSTTAGDSAGADGQVAEGASAAHGAATAHAPAPTTAPTHVAAKLPKTYSRAVQTVESNGSPGTLPGAAAHPPAPSKPLVTSAPAPPTPGVAKVAKIFAAMPPKDAAMVLEQLEDAEVQSIISCLSEKQAAAILRNFPPPRAALISLAVLRSAMAKP
ncbi:MAG: hypothetical protein ABI910_15230 [Gemmatimonadota bacterium]